MQIGKPEEVCSRPHVVEFKQKNWEYDVSERALFCQWFPFLNAICCCLCFHFNFQVAGFHVSAKCESTWRKFPKNGKQRRRQMLSPFFVWIYFVQIYLFCSCEQVRTAAEELTIGCKSLKSCDPNASVSENRVTDFAKKAKGPLPLYPLVPCSGERALESPKLR